MTHDEAISLLIRIAAELALSREIPDPELPEFKPIGRKRAAEIRRANIYRCQDIKRAVDALRKARKP